jgi:hypothetical protein
MVAARAIIAGQTALETSSKANLVYRLGDRGHFPLHRVLVVGRSARAESAGDYGYLPGCIHGCPGDLDSIHPASIGQSKDRGGVIKSGPGRDGISATGKPSRSVQIGASSIPDHAPTEKLLKTLAGYNGAFESVDAAMQDIVDILREREVSWAMIGQTLAVSRQAAWKRFR